MTKFKIYIRTLGNIEEMANTYANVFSGKVVKRSFIDQTATDHSGSRTDVNYVNVQIFNNLTIMVSSYKNTMPLHGYGQDVIITFDNLEEFEGAYSKLIQSDKFKIDFDKVDKNFGGGITIVKFYDVWGNGWILERKTSI